MLVRNLRARHLNMIALGGSIGTGIFLASGYAIHIAGPGGALAAYSLIAIMVYFLITSLGEMATHRPTTGSFCEYSSRYVDPSFGVAMSYNYWFNWAITIAAEISAATIIMKYWFPDISAVMISALFFGLVFFVNLFSVRVYGETEYWMSFLKVAVIVVFIILCCFLISKKSEFGIANFTIADGPFHNGWLGFASVFLIAGFSFQGSELIGIGAGEVKDPEKSIPKAVRTIFWRLVLFYVLTTLFISLLVPFNSPALANQDSVDSSPFTLVFQSYFGHGFATNLINTIILIAVVSAANASMYASTRTLWYMGTTGQAPKFFSKTTKYGLPIYALLATAAIGSVIFLSSLIGNGRMFTILLTISALCGFIAWFGIALSHYCFRKYHLKGDLSALKYKAKLFPYAPVIAMVMIVVIVAGQIYTLTGDITIGVILQQYGALIAFIAIIVLHKFFSKKHMQIVDDKVTWVGAETEKLSIK
ncbi:amino acid permease [Piscirickettsia salmonis]|uniref:amino acid permease n=1 Tax=Piscirickettsia salmonis TaxID=1238 RepID=UPI0007C8AFF6|nr:Lysine-specific permease [Piscirickettsiaceae bacterium NZ-RLO1]